MTSAQHYLALRPCIELLTVGGDPGGGQTLLIPAGGTTSALFPTTNLNILRLSEHFELHQSQSRTTSFLLLLTSGGLIVYLLYKGLSDEDDGQPPRQQRQRRQRWSAQNWLRWLLFGDTNDLRGQYFGPIQPQPLKRVEKQAKNIVYVSPCPNCVRGVCKIKKHHQLLCHKKQYVPILESASTSGSSTPIRPRSIWSADDETSDEEQRRQILVKESPSRRKRSSRIPPEGRDSRQHSKNASKIVGMARDDESMDSIAGVTGSMVDLVKGAREVRRLIREASFDSLASEYSLDFENGLGNQTASQFDNIYDEINRLKDNCDYMGENIDFNSSELPGGTKMTTSKSENLFSKESTPPSSMDSLRSSPDLRNLHKIIHSAPRNKALWTLTHNTGFSDNDSNASPINHHREQSPMTRDIRNAKYKVVLSSNNSECGDWEWDSEGLSAEFTNPDFTNHQHENWLQDDVLELDLEAELLTSTFAQRRRDSSESELDSSSYYNKVRLPPSGRSSAMSSGHNPESGYPDLKSVMSMTFSRSSSSSSLKNMQDSYYFYPRKSRKSGFSSDESGIEDKSMDSSTYSMASTSMKSSVNTPLSPVHEAKESPNKSSPEKTQQKKGHSARRRLPQTTKN